MFIYFTLTPCLRTGLCLYSMHKFCPSFKMQEDQIHIVRFKHGQIPHLAHLYTGGSEKKN